MAKTNPNRFAADISKILADYVDVTKENLADVTKAFAKKGAKEVSRAASGAVGGGPYASGWTSKVVSGRVSTEAVIYNKYPGMPHLLEAGHALRQGGRARAFPHIKGAEQEIVTEYIKEVLAKL